MSPQTNNPPTLSNQCQQTSPRSDVKQERAKATRATVLLAAARVFESRGFAAATISDILEEAGVTKGALYFHFDSKESLAREIVSSQVSWRDKSPEREQNPVQRVIDISHAFGMALRQDPLARASIRLTLERNTFQTDDPSPYVGWNADVEAILVDAHRAGVMLTHISPAAAARLITSVFTGAQLASEATTGRTDLTTRIEEIWQLLLPALVDPDVVDTLNPRGSSEPSRRGVQGLSRAIKA